MKTPRFDVPLSTMTALARGGGGPDVMNLLVRVRRSRTLLLIRWVVGRAQAGDHPDAGVAVAAYRELARIHRLAPDAVRRVLDHPSVGAWARHTALRLSGTDTAMARPGELANVALAAAVRGSVSASVVLSAGATEQEVTLPSIGTSLVRGRGRHAAVRAGDNRIELAIGGGVVHVPADPNRAAEDWAGLPRITSSHDGKRIDLKLDDWRFGPLAADLTASVEPSPRYDLDAWRARIADGWRILVERHPDVAAELAIVVRVLTPLRSRPGVPTSATASDGFGCVLLSLPPTDQAFAETMTHELQHAKLSVVLDLFPLVKPHSRARSYYAPWRSDPRPLVGILHGTYAHLGVAAFWRAENGPAADAQFARWRLATLDTANSLLSGDDLTPVGRAFVENIAGALEEWSVSDVSEDIMTAARTAILEHRTKWLAEHTHGQH